MDKIMTSQYKILWVEDYPMSIRRIKTEVSKHIREKYLEDIGAEHINVINDVGLFKNIVNNNLGDYSLKLIKNFILRLFSTRHNMIIYKINYKKIILKMLKALLVTNY
jgi:hypothetical protein